DTRALTRRIAGTGQVAAGIFAGDDAQATDAELVAQVRNWSKPATEQLLAEVTTGTAYDVVAETPQHTVALIDLGVRRSTINQLVQRGNTVKVLPASATAEDIAEAKVDGVVFSSGPGNPAEATAQIELATALLDAKTPLLGIGLGHQIIARALGYDTALLAQAQ